MSQQSLDYNSLGFQYIKTDKRFVATYKNNQWDEGHLTEDNTVVLNESAGILQYCQQVFEGLKAYRWQDGSIVCFRPDCNAQRMYDSAKRLQMPSVPKELFLQAIEEVVKANVDWVPPYGSGAALYLRPYEFGTSTVLGVAPAKEFQFRVFATPVGPYFKQGSKPVSLRVSDFDRAAPHGTGNVKAGLNYAMSLYATTLAHEEGYAENLYLDPATRTYVEETGGTNVLFVDKDGTLVVPKSDSILPSITRRSIIYIAQNYLHMKVDERKVKFEEVKDFVECALCGTAAVISPVGRIDYSTDQSILFPSGMEKSGETFAKLRETMVSIQTGKLEAPEGWIYKII